MDFSDNHILDVFWYYGNLGVSKLVIDDEYICQVTILMYSIFTVDTRCGDGGRECRLDVPSQAAIECMAYYGKEPVVCAIYVIKT